MAIAHFEKGLLSCLYRCTRTKIPQPGPPIFSRSECLACCSTRSALLHYSHENKFLGLPPSSFRKQKKFDIFAILYLHGGIDLVKGQH